MLNCWAPNTVFSGSVDHMIRVWELKTLQCIATLNGHSDTVMSLLCWSDYLLLCSLDQTIKVWGNAEDGHSEVAFTHTEEQGLLGLPGMNIAKIISQSCSTLGMTILCSYTSSHRSPRGANCSQNKKLEIFRQGLTASSSLEMQVAL